MASSWSTQSFVAVVGLLPATGRGAHAAAEPFIARYWPAMVFTMVGALLPVVARVAWSFARFVRIRLNPSRHSETGLLGTWFVYHFSRRDDRPLMRTERWQMKLNWRGQIVVNTSDDQMTELIYKGKLEDIDSVHLKCRMKGARHHEECYIRIIYPIPSDRHSTFGLFTGENFDHDVFSTVYLFSRDPLTPAVASTRLRRKLQQSTEPGLNGIVLYPGAGSGRSALTTASD